VNLFIGAPIWTSKTWVGSLLPKGTKSGQFLREYARRLTTVEGNTTFYATPGPNTVTQWAEETPETFRFCFKVPRTISHDGTLAKHIPDAAAFVERMRPLGPRLGPMFLQMPPSYSPGQVEDLKTFLESWPEDVRLAVEVRHLRWFDEPYNEGLNTLLARYGFARVVIDTRPIRQLEGDPILKGSVYENLLQARKRKPDVPVQPNITGPFIFLRYIGHPQISVNQPFIEEWTDYLASLPDTVSETYVFCHCPDDSQDPLICREFYQQARQKITLPALPWDSAGQTEPPAEQPRLF